MTTKRASRKKEEVQRLTRDNVPEIVAALKELNSTTTPRWNVVDALELLIDSGNFAHARALAERIIPLVNGDGRERLFKGYLALCDLMINGAQTEAIRELEALYVEIHHNGHSVADRVRIALLLSRSLSVCVGMGSLSEAALLRARGVLQVELTRVVEACNPEFQCVVATELAKSYLHAPTSDPRAAMGILRDPRLLQAMSLVPIDLSFDVRRITYQVTRAVGAGCDIEFSDEQLRAEARVVGGVARALAELAIARRAAAPCEDRLDKAAELFETNEFMSGAFEARFLLGSQALDRGHNSVAERQLRQADRLAAGVGFLHGQLLARVGLFQAAIIGAQDGEATSRADELSSLMSSEVALGSMGLNMAAARQIVGQVVEALEMARRCQGFFSRQGIEHSEAQALHTLGSCEARLGQWPAAYTAWERSVQIDEERCAFISACERRALVVQALVMTDITTSGQVDSATRALCQELLDESYQTLRRFGQSSEARRIEARLHTVNAQLCVMTKSSVAALRHTSAARELFESLGMDHDAALVEALSGLAMIEVGKCGSTEIVEEAVLTLQRPLQFFTGSEYRHIRWKVLYYLAVAGVVISQRKSQAMDKLKWKDLATGWLKDALREVAQLDEAAGGANASQPDSEFSPGLKPSALEALKVTLGIGAQRSRRAERDLVPEVGPGDGVVH